MVGGSERLDRVYAELLKHHEGWALYHKADPCQMRPGTFGFFDADGTWKPIAQLMDDNLQHEGWTGLKKPTDVRENGGRIAWGPKYSTGVRSMSLGGELGIPASVSPGLQLSATFKVDDRDDKGAVLCAEAPITLSFAADDRPLLQWVAENSRRILAEHGRALREHGLWVVTKTYTTRRYLVSVLHSAGTELSVGLEADVSGFFTLAPGCRFATAGGEASTAVYEDERGVVVFMCGIYIAKKMFGGNLNTQDRREKQKMLRSGGQEGEVTILSTEPDGSEAVLVVQRLGTD